MKQFILIVSMMIPFMGFTQTYISLNKAGVKKKLKNYAADNDSLRYTLKETNTSVSFLLNDPRMQKAEFTYTFDKAGKCISEKIVSSCDSCMQKFLQNALNRTEYGWRKVNENQYISEFSKKMMLELPADSTLHYFSIFQTNWSRPMYDLLTKSLQ